LQLQAVSDADKQPSLQVDQRKAVLAEL